MKVIRHYFIDTGFFALLLIAGGCTGETEIGGGNGQ